MRYNYGDNSSVSLQRIMYASLEPSKAALNAAYFNIFQETVLNRVILGTRIEPNDLWRNTRVVSNALQVEVQQLSLRQQGLVAIDISSRPNVNTRT